MSAPTGFRFKIVCFTIEGLNSFATILFFNYLYFFMRFRFGFGDKRNLLLAALLGLTYTIAAWQAGRFAHRFGYFTALKIGFGLMAAGLAAGSQMASAPGVILAATVTNIGMCFIWPTLEALVSESEPPAGVPRAVGIYNIVWAVTNALAFFIGGTLVVQFGFKSIFYLPLVMVLAQLALTLWLQNHASETARAAAGETNRRAAPRPEPPIAGTGKNISAAWRGWRIRSPTSPSTHSSLSRPALPRNSMSRRCSRDSSGRCGVSSGSARSSCLWRWTDWHYRFRWLAASFRGAHFVVRDHFAVAESRCAHRRTNLFWRRHRPDLLLVVVLLDGRRLG